MRDMAMYLKVVGDANDGAHARIPNLVWWSWNPNSGDTGGLVDDGWVNVLLCCLKGLGTPNEKARL